MSNLSAEVLVRREAKRQEYWERVQRRVCPNCQAVRSEESVYCLTCLQVRRAWNRRHQRKVAEARRLAPGPNILYCCGPGHPHPAAPYRLTLLWSRASPSRRPS